MTTWFLWDVMGVADFKMKIGFSYTPCVSNSGTQGKGAVATWDMLFLWWIVIVQRPKQVMQEHLKSCSSLVYIRTVHIPLGKQVTVKYNINGYSEK